MIDPSNARKYLRNAIGEIALVVIGILIALRINNYPIGILPMSPFRCTWHGPLGNEARKIRLEINSILVYTLYYGNFNPSNSSIQELVQSGGLKLLSDDSLKTLLFD